MFFKNIIKHNQMYLIVILRSDFIFFLILEMIKIFKYEKD